MPLKRERGGQRSSSFAICSDVTEAHRVKNTQANFLCVFLSTRYLRHQSRITNNFAGSQLRSRVYLSVTDSFISLAHYLPLRIIKRRRDENYPATVVRSVFSWNTSIGSGSGAEYYLDRDFRKRPNDLGLWKKMIDLEP